MPSLMTFLGEAARAAGQRPLAAAGAALGNLFFILAGAIVPLLIGEVIALAVPGGSTSALREVAITWAAITVLWLAAEWLLAWAAGDILSHYSHRMRTATLHALHGDPHTQQDAGGIATRMTSDVDAIELAMMELLIGSITDFGRLLVVTAALTFIEPVLGGLFLVFLVLFIVFQRVVAKPVDRANDDRQDAVDSMSSKLAETVRTVPVIHAYDLQGWDAERFDAASVRLRRATRKRQLVGWWPYWLGAATGQAALLVILVAAAYFAQSGRDTVTEVAASMMYVQGAVAALLMLAAFLPMAQRAGVSVLRVRELAGAAPPPPAPDSLPAQRASADPVPLSLHQAAIALPDGRVLLHPTTLEIAAGRWTTVVGGSGAGKSTLLGLITGQRVPTSGQVLINGLDVHTARHEVRTSLVFQDSLLFTTTAAENIRAGDRGADDDAVRAAAALAELDEVLSALPEGYATVIDTTGHIISGGQRQRLALARALVRRPQLLLLDEATSALDPATATAVWRTMRRIARERGITVVAVCHQLDLAVDSDTIVVMQSGHVVEMGSPHELDRANGPWRELFDAHRRVAAHDLDSIERLMSEHPELLPTDPDERADLARRSRISDAAPGEVVCHAGEPLDALVLVSSGRLEVSDGTSRYTLGPGSALGNLTDLVSGRISVDARMISGGQLVLIPRRALLPSLLDLLESDPATAAILAWLARVERASREDLAARLGPDGEAVVDGLLRGGALRVHDDGQIGVIVGRRRTMSSGLLDGLLDP